MIKLWLEKRRLLKEQKDFRSGFNWAMSHYYLDNANIGDIKTCVYNDDVNAFDQGAYEAIKIIERYNEMSENI